MIFILPQLLHVSEKAKILPLRKGFSTLPYKLSSLSGGWYRPGHVYGMMITDLDLMLHLRVDLGRE